MNHWKYLDLGMELAGLLIAPPVVGALLGRWIDAKVGTDYYWTFGLLVLGILTGLWSMYKRLRGLTR